MTTDGRLEGSVRNGFRFFLWMGLAALMAFLVSVNGASAGQFRLIEFKQATVNFKKFSGARHWQVTDPQTELNLTVNTDFLKYLYWNNTVHSITDKSNFAYIGWHFFVGIRVAPFLDLQYEHFSRHLMDDRATNGWFPYEDSLGFNLHLYRDPRLGASVFGWR